MASGLSGNPLVRDLARLMTFAESTAVYAGLPLGNVRGKVVDVNDPENKGRVRVLFDMVNAEDIPEIEGSGIFSGARDGQGKMYSHWIDASPAFVGRQPPSLVGHRVRIDLSLRQYHYAILGDTIYDPQNLTDSAASALKVPANSTMVRLPIYPANGLPPPCEENLGCSVIEEGGPMNSDWVCVCLKRDGKYTWVRHADLAHGHAGGNDVTSQVDSAGNRPSPGQMASTYDHVFVTSHQEMKKAGRTGYSTAPAGNPWGVAAAWQPPPMSDIKSYDFVDGPFLDQNKALDIARNSGFTNNVAGSFTTSYDPAIPAIVEAVPGVNFAKVALEKAQTILKVSEGLRNSIPNPLSLTSAPTKFIVETSLSALKTYAPASTKFVLSTLQNPAGTVKNLLPKLPSLPK